MGHSVKEVLPPCRNEPHFFAHWPVFGEDEISAATSVLASGKVNYWTGNEGRSFENEFSEFAGTERAVALANGTLALEAALIGIGFQPGDEAIVTPRSFVASASPVVLAGGIPIFVDVDRKSGNLDPKAVERAISPRTRAIIAVHLGGRPCDMDALTAIAESRNIALIEDCAQAHGARYRGRCVGSIGIVGAWSFCQDKIMSTAGEGGMLTTSDETIWRRVWEYKDHGKSFERVHRQDHASGYRWVHDGIGTNWRMTEVQSAVGRVELRRLEGWVNRRRQNARILDARLQESAALRIEVPAEFEVHAYYKYYFYVRPDALKPDWSRDRIMDSVGSFGVPCYSGSCSEIYLERGFADRGFSPPSRLPVARELGETALMLLVHPTLGETDMNYAAGVVNDVMREATR